MTAMKVLYVLNAMGGGASRGIYEYLRARDANQFEAYAILPPGNEQLYQSIKPLFADIKIMPLTWWNTKTEKDFLRRSALMLAHWRRGYSLDHDVEVIKDCIQRWNIDLVHTGTAMTLSGALAARALDVPHIWHIKETVGSENRVQFPMSDDDLIQYMDGLSDQIVAMSDYIGKIFRDHGSHKLSVIPDGVNLVRYTTPTRTLRQHLGISDDELLVGMVASMVSVWKGHDVFIKMAALLKKRYPQARFMIIGDKPNPKARWPNNLTLKYYHDLVQLAASLNLGDRLIFANPFPDSSDIMYSIDVLVHTCDIEPFGRIAVEAMAAGKPVVGPQTGGIAETVVDHVTGLLVPPRDEMAFAQAVETLLIDPTLRQRFGEAGRKRVADEYDNEVLLERLNALYQRVIKASAGA